ncbi:MAG: hypothetical protein KKE64_00295, partial [Candidatus Omnitrophica bacterium]|nr:hypothetical protein [Candidatus Omnitrophota bacterium]
DQALGELDLVRVKSEEFKEYQKKDSCVIAGTVNEAKLLVLGIKQGILEQLLKDKDKNIGILQDEISKRDRDIKIQSEEIARRDQAIETQEREICSRDETIRQINIRAEEYEKTINGLLLELKKLSTGD